MTKTLELYKGNAVNILRKIGQESIDMVITSPPYDNLRSYNGNADDWNDSVWRQVFQELYRVLKRGGVIVWVVSDATIKGSETGTSFKQALYAMECGFNLHDTMIWAKDTFPFPDKTRYQNNFEYMFVLSKGTPKTTNLIADRKNKWYGTKIHGTSRNSSDSLYKKSNHNRTVIKEFGVRFNVWNMPGEKKNKTGHPAPFPEQLAADHITTWTNKGDWVLDCFMGSGTSGLAARKMDRNFIGIEIDEEYYKKAKQRIEQ